MNIIDFSSGEILSEQEYHIDNNDGTITNYSAVFEDIESIYAKGKLYIDAVRYETEGSVRYNTDISVPAKNIKDKLININFDTGHIISYFDYLNMIDFMTNNAADSDKSIKLKCITYKSPIANKEDQFAVHLNILDKDYEIYVDNENSFTTNGIIATENHTKPVKYKVKYLFTPEGYRLIEDNINETTDILSIDNKFIVKNYVLEELPVYDIIYSNITPLRTRAVSMSMEIDGITERKVPSYKRLLFTNEKYNNIYIIEKILYDTDRPLPIKNNAYYSITLIEKDVDTNLSRITRYIVDMGPDKDDPIYDYLYNIMDNNANDVTVLLPEK